MAAAPSPFALHPADAIQGIINLTMREGVKLYQNATRSFSTDPQTISTVKLRGSMVTSKKWKAKHHASDGAMRSLRSQTISQILWEEPGISSRTMGNFRSITYVRGKPPIYTEFQEWHKIQHTYISA